MAGAQEKQRLLILHSYHAGLTWTEGQDRGIREIFKPRQNIEIFTEYLDSKRMPLNKILVPFAAFLGRKYSPDFFDAVMVTDNSALTFFSLYHKRLFPNVPVVFCGILAGLETQTLLIDHGVLDRFGLDDRLVPSSAIVIHKPFSVYQAYEGEIWGIGMTLLLLLILVLVLAVNVMSRRESEANLHVTLQSIGDAVIATDCEGIITRMNPVAEALTGWNLKEAVGQKIDRVFYLIHSRTREKVVNPVERVLASGHVEGVSDHTVLVSKTGIEYRIADSGAPIVGSDGKMKGVVLVFRDVTETHQKTREISDQKELLEATFSSIQDGLSILNTDRTIRFANAVMEGWHADKLPLVGKKCHEVYYNRRTKCDTCSGDSCVSTGSPKRRVIEMPYASGPGSRAIELSSYPIKRAKTGDITGSVEIIRDITEQKQLEAQLRQAQKHEAIGNLAGGIAHDFNNILSGIFGFCQLAKIHMGNPDKARDHLDSLMKAANRATQLVRQILSFSRQTDQRTYLISLLPVVTEVLKLLRSSLPATIEIENRFDTNSLVEADPTQIHQLVMNLGTNAFHAMKETGGRLTIQGRDIDIQETTPVPVNGMIRGMIPGKYLMLEVMDTGEGMTETILQKAYDPYFTTREKGQGTGMGLALARSVVARHRGNMTIESTPGKGTIVTVYLPISDKKKRDQRKEIGLFVKGGTEHLMFVDDEVDICEPTREFLRDYGYRVSIYLEGPGALEAFQAAPESYDLLITDMTMPKMKGSLLAEKILAIRPDLPVLLCSGYLDDAMEQQALDIGIRKCLLKPVSNQSLLMLIRKIFDDKNG